MIKGTLADLDTPVLKAMRDLCPKVKGESVEFSAVGRTVKLTVASRAAAILELEKRGIKPTAGDLAVLRIARGG